MCTILDAAEERGVNRGEITISSSTRSSAIFAIESPFFIFF